MEKIAIDVLILKAVVFTFNFVMFRLCSVNGNDINKRTVGIYFHLTKKPEI
jgi:hypothetical protein